MRTCWSLRGRLTLWLTTVALVPTALALAMGGTFLGRSVERELQALLAEELEEARLRLAAAADPAARLANVSAELAAQHPGVGMAWRIRDAAKQSLAEAGQLSLLDQDQHGGATGELPPGADGNGVAGTGRHRTSIVTGTIALPGARVAELVLDGSALAALRDRFWLAAGLTAVVGTIVALVLAHVLARRIASLVRRVAVNVREDASPRSDRVVAQDRSILHGGSSAPSSAAQRGSLAQRLSAAAGGGVARHDQRARCPHDRVGTLPTEIQDVADELAAKLATIRRHSRDAQLYTASLAHELRSPIQNLIGAAEVTLLRQRDESTYREVLRGQLDELHELADAVDNLLSLCAPRAEMRSADHESFDLGEEWRLRCEREERRGQRRGIVVRTDVHGSLLVRGDREALLRAIRNVVANALDWSPDGGVVTVEFVERDGSIVIDVDDQGPGIAMEDRGAIFRPLARVPRRPTGRAGFGLGLAITRSAVERQGGTVLILDAPAGGARLRLTIPKAPP